MPADERDPRTDPRPGDVWEVDEVTTCEVQAIHEGGCVTYAKRTGIYSSRANWLKRIKDARVIARGVERGPNMGGCTAKAELDFKMLRGVVPDVVTLNGVEYIRKHAADSKEAP